MSEILNVEMLSRVQFAVVAGLHILFPPLTIGLSLIIFFLEASWVRTKDLFYLQHTKFWMRIFVLNFGIGVVSGIPMEFLFGVNWGPLSTNNGAFLGNLLGFEAVLAFMLEAAFLSIMVFGWTRVPPKAHLAATGIVTFAATLSAFWIMSASSWMQTPSGITLVNDKIVISDYLAAIFNPSFPASFLHMEMASIELSLFVTGGISAWYILKGRNTDFFLRLLKISLTALILVAPLQVLLGDWEGQNIAHHQPAKLAATEAHWNTNPPGTGASWSLLAWPNRETQSNDWSIEIPYVLSLLIHHDPKASVIGLREFPREDQPPVLIPYYTFRIMMAIGFFFAGLALWTGWLWWRGRLDMTHAPRQRWLWRAWILSIPLAYLAVESGWFLREVGRQPWVIYGIMRTEHAYSQIPLQSLIWSLGSYALLYTTLIVIGFYFARRILREGPDLDTPIKTFSGSHKPSAELAHRTQGS
ncbi:cytochrome ubiquinol oxidase subunit I [Thermithiobacillus plumbiphilus]|uniref:Cytochrome ubiquinol oxidase subunit I n=1 Tax=Thermithiobacillus plumbiphilus TaxID=1729899 RepID=A0ABU9D7V1_9PROT